MENAKDQLPQIMTSKNFGLALSSKDSLLNWLEFYFEYASPVALSTRKEEERDIRTFVSFMVRETAYDKRTDWTPRVSQVFRKELQSQINESGTRRYNDRIINHHIASLKSFSKWIHKHCPFPLGDPMAEIRENKTHSLLDIERALTKREYRLLLDHADRLTNVGGLSIDRSRYKDVSNRPRRKNYRPYRNCAIIYTLLETGMRRAAVTHITLDDLDRKAKKITTLKKGGNQHSYKISEQRFKAIENYIKLERPFDAEYYTSPILFLAAHNTKNQSGAILPRQINRIWDEVWKRARIEGKTPHSAKHAMGMHIQENTGNSEAVQKQLGHKNVAYSLGYARITDSEMEKVLENR